MYPRITKDMILYGNGVWMMKDPYLHMRTSLGDVGLWLVRSASFLHCVPSGNTCYDGEYCYRLAVALVRLYG